MAKKQVYRVIRRNGEAVVISGKIIGFKGARDFMKQAFMHCIGISSDVMLSKTAKDFNAVYKDRFAEFEGITWQLVTVK